MGDNVNELKKAVTHPYVFYKQYAAFCNLRTRQPIITDDTPLDTSARIRNVIGRINRLLDYSNDKDSYQITEQAAHALSMTECPESLKPTLDHIATYPEFDGKLIRTMLRPIATVDVMSRHVKYPKTYEALEFYKSVPDRERALKFAIKKILWTALRLKPYGVCRNYFFECANLLLKPEYQAIPEFKATLEQLSWAMWTMEPTAHTISETTAQKILKQMPDSDDNYDRNQLDHILYFAKVI